MNTDISMLANHPVIIGGGAAGLMTALHLAPEPVVLLSKARLVRKRRACGHRADSQPRWAMTTTRPCI